MSQPCSICRDPQRDSINVSLLRDGTRSTARQFQVSRSALDRHKRHLVRADPASRPFEVVLTAQATTPLLARLDGLIQQCEGVLAQALAEKNLPGTTRVFKELRAYLEMKYKLESEQRRNREPSKDHPEQKSRTRDVLQRSPEEVYEDLETITLRLHIRASRRRLGEQAIIGEPSNLEYLRHQSAALNARIEQRALLEQSVGLARMLTCDDKRLVVKGNG